MTITSCITISNGNLVVNGKTILKGVPENIILASGAALGLTAGAFIGAASPNSQSLHVFPMGILEDLRFMCCFRFKLWWMTQRMGTCGKDVPLETQFMLVESNDESSEGESTIYTVFLPLLEGPFRSALQGNDRNELEICLESGDDAIKTDNGINLVYMHTGTNPFEVVNQAVKAVEKHLQTFVHREKKRLPSFIDWFGWCTWDAFYTNITAEGVQQGLESLSSGGTPPRFLIIDDGWQQIGSEDKNDPSCVVQEGAQFANRLTGIKENAKFQKKQDEQKSDQVPGLKLVVEDAKRNHNVKFVYVWHALAGYWGGVKPAASGMEHYDTALAYPVQSPGVTGNQPDIVMDSLSIHGLGLVPPKKVFNFYNELHAYLSSCGVDGVKVDVQNIIETLGAGHGGRVALTRAYLQALEASIARNFSDNGCISCMCHNTDGIYSAKQIAVIRASDDFYPGDPASHTIHIASVAYNSFFLGELMLPDWDMFHSLHPAADYHAAARAVGGCPIYVSDKPGKHNFELLSKMVLPDGSILRARLPGRPTRDCLLADPARDGVSLLKIWNLNKCSGVVGVFNCQGAGWCKVEKKNRIHNASPARLTARVRATDVEGIAEVAGKNWKGEVVAYMYRTGELVRIPKESSLEVRLRVLEYELFHFCPVEEIEGGVAFAPIGLLDMFNTGGAVEEFGGDGGSGVVRMKVRGSGRLGAYCSRRPVKCTVKGSEREFEYDSQTGLVTVNLSVAPEEMYRWPLEFQV